MSALTSLVKIFGVGIDTLVLNIMPTDSSFEIVSRRVDPELQAELTILKQRAQDEEEDIETRFVFDGAPLMMRTKGSEGFNWIMHNSKITLAVNRGSKMRLLGQVRFSSEYLWPFNVRRNVGKAISDVYIFLTTIFGQYIKYQVSNCDLAVDVGYLDLGSVSDVKNHFVTRAQLDDQMPLNSADDGMIDGPDSIKRRWRRMTGLAFGARTGKVSALLYDKTHEIKYKSPQKRWFHDIWYSVKDENGNAVWDGESPVWRIEVRFKRAALHEGDVEDAFGLEDLLFGMWAYAVGHVGGDADGLPDGWLRYVVPTDDSNRSRWPVHPDWEVIQGAFAPPAPLEETAYEREEREQEEYLQAVDEELAARPMETPQTKRAKHGRGLGAPDRQTRSSSPAPLELKPFIRTRKREENLRQLVAQIAGCVVTAEAWRRGPNERLSPDVERDMSETFHFLYKACEDYLEEKERDFSKLVYKKRVLYSVEASA